MSVQRISGKADFDPSNPYGYQLVDENEGLGPSPQYEVCNDDDPGKAYTNPKD